MNLSEKPTSSGGRTVASDAQVVAGRRASNTATKAVDRPQSAVSHNRVAPGGGGLRDRARRHPAAQPTPIASHRRDPSADNYLASSPGRPSTNDVIQSPTALRSGAAGSAPRIKPILKYQPPPTSFARPAAAAEPTVHGAKTADIGRATKGASSGPRNSSPGYQTKPMTPRAACRTTSGSTNSYAMQFKKYHQSRLQQQLPLIDLASTRDVTAEGSVEQQPTPLPLPLERTPESSYTPTPRQRQLQHQLQFDADSLDEPFVAVKTEVGAAQTDLQAAFDADGGIPASYLMPSRNEEDNLPNSDDDNNGEEDVATEATPDANDVPPVADNETASSSVSSAETCVSSTLTDAGEVGEQPEHDWQSAQEQRRVTGADSSDSMTNPPFTVHDNNVATTTYMAVAPPSLDDWIIAISLSPTHWEPGNSAEMTTIAAGILTRLQQTIDKMAVGGDRKLVFDADPQGERVGSSAADLNGGTETSENYADGADCRDQAAPAARSDSLETLMSFSEKDMWLAALAEIESAAALIADPADQCADGQPLPPCGETAAYSPGQPMSEPDGAQRETVIPCWRHSYGDDLVLETAETAVLPLPPDTSNDVERPQAESTMENDGRRFAVDVVEISPQECPSICPAKDQSPHDDGPVSAGRLSTSTSDWFESAAASPRDGSQRFSDYRDLDDARIGTDDDGVQMAAAAAVGVAVSAAINIVENSADEKDDQQQQAENGEDAWSREYETAQPLEPTINRSIIRQMMDGSNSDFEQDETACMEEPIKFPNLRHQALPDPYTSSRGRSHRLPGPAAAASSDVPRRRTASASVTRIPSIGRNLSASHSSSSRPSTSLHRTDVVTAQQPRRPQPSTTSSSCAVRHQVRETVNSGLKLLPRSTTSVLGKTSSRRLLTTSTSCGGGAGSGTGSGGFVLTGAPDFADSKDLRGAARHSTADGGQLTRAKSGSNVVAPKMKPWK